MEDPIKVQGKKAVSNIQVIRSKFEKAPSSNKLQLIQEFKQSFKKIMAYFRVEKNYQIVQVLSQKIPELDAELKSMKQVYQMETQAKPSIIRLIPDKPLGEDPIQPIKPCEKQSPQKLPKVIPPIDKKKSEAEISLQNAIVKEKPNIKWDDIGGLQQAKNVLQEAVILPMKFPQVFVGERTPWKGILMYGPPGTGKTFLAKACATEMTGGTFFSISASDLMSKYVGESQKTMKAMFSLARNEKPSIIFIDEIDSIAGQRSSDQNEASRRVKTEFLVQMQGVGNECKDVLVLGATNLPWALDSAVRRRFQKRVYIPLPDMKARMAIIKKVISKNAAIVSQEELMILCNRTQGYSGSDLANLANDALMEPVRNLEKTKKWVQIEYKGEIKYAPFNEQLPEDPNCKYFKGNMYDLKQKGYMIYLSTKFSDFLSALQRSKPSVSPKDLDRYVEWTKNFGMQG